MINIMYAVDPIKRIVKPMSGHAVTEQDHEASSLRFAFPDNIAGTGLESTGTAVRVMYIRPDGGDPVAKTLTFYKHSGGYYLYDWNLQKSDLQKEGYLAFSLCILDISGGEVSEWHTTPCAVRVLSTIHTDDSDEGDDTITPTVAQRVAVLETMIQRVASGAPIVVSSVSAMTDTEQIYVLSTDGNWYYYDGTAWVAGGEYGGVLAGSITTDKLAAGAVTTAKIADGAITAAKLSDDITFGNAIEEVKADLCDFNVCNIIYSCPKMQNTISNGITMTANGDGSYTFSGTATGTALFNILNKDIPGRDVVPDNFVFDDIYHIEYTPANQSLYMDFWLYDASGNYIVGISASNTGKDLRFVSESSKIILRFRVERGTTISTTVRPVLYNMKSLPNNQLTLLAKTLKTEQNSLAGKFTKVESSFVNEGEYNQLLRYSSYPYIYTNNNITYKLEEDYTWTITGTSTNISFCNFVLNTEDLPSWIKEGTYLKLVNKTGIVKLAAYFYDENNTYIDGANVTYTGSILIPYGTKHALIRFMVENGVTINISHGVLGVYANSKSIIRLVNTSTNSGCILKDNILDTIHINKIDGSGTVKIGTSNIYEIQAGDKTASGVTYAYNVTDNSVTVTSSGATSDNIEATHYSSGGMSYHFMLSFSKSCYFTFKSNPSEWLSYDSKIKYQIYRNGSLVEYERGLGFTYLARPNDVWGFRILVNSGFSGSITFRPQLNIGKNLLDYELPKSREYTSDDNNKDISVESKAVSILSTGCSYKFSYATKQSSLKNSVMRPMLSFTDDDTTNCSYVQRYHDVFENTGAVGTYAVMTGRMTTKKREQGGYRYDEEGELESLLKEYEMEGFGMVLHCFWQNDAVDSTRYFTLAERDISKCRENMLRALREYKSLGFQNEKLWITPYGVQDEEIQNLARELGLECVISMSNNTIITPNYANRWCIPRYSLSMNSNIDFLKEQMRLTVAMNGWINFVTHVNSWNTSDVTTMTTKVRDIISYAQTLGIEIGTFAQCYEAWKPILYDYEVKHGIK